MARNNTMLFVAAAVVVGIILIAQNSDAGDNPTEAVTPGATMVSQDQLAQTEALEGFRSTAYKDGSNGGVQLYSIGYGHQIQPGEQSLLTGSISQAQAQQMLLNDMQTVVDTINNSGDQFTQGQFDALADLGYNAGTGATQAAINLYESQGPAAVAAWLPTAYIYWHPTPGGAAVVSQTNVARRLKELANWNAGAPIQNTSLAANGGSTDTGGGFFNIGSGIPDELDQ